MKHFLRRKAQALGLYEGLGIAVARVKGWLVGIRISRLSDATYCLQDRAGRKMFIHPKHAIYLPDFVNYFDFYYGGVISEPNNEVHYETPAWHVPVKWGRPLYFTSFAESEDVVTLYLQHAGVRDGDIIFDLGAYCGLTALAFAEKVGDKGRVYAFEPDPANFAALQMNLKRYAPRNVTAENAAVWKSSGEIWFQAEGTVASRIESLAPRTDSMVRVDAVRLEDYLVRNGIQRVDLIKLDVEGAEADILDASRAVLQKYKPTVILEVHPVREVLTTAACQSVLHEEGYKSYQVRQPGTKAPLVVAKPLAVS